MSEEPRRWNVEPGARSQLRESLENANQELQLGNAQKVTGDAGGGPGLRGSSRGEDGQSLVELALTLPALLLVVTGLMAFAVAMNNYLILTDATAVGARQLTVSRGQTIDPCNTLATAVYAAAPLLKRSNLSFSVTLNGTAYSGTSCSGSSTSGAPANMVLGTNAVVTVTYPFTLNMYGLKLSAVGAVLTAQTTELMQ